MIHTHFQLDKKKYRNTYMTAMTIYYIRIYMISLFIGILIIGGIGIFTGNTTFRQSALSMALTFIPIIVLCVIIAYGMSLHDVRKIAKKHPELMSGDIKMKFEKNFLVMQKDGTNKKYNYEPYRFYRGLGNSFILYQPQVSASLVVPKNQLTKEQIKIIKDYVKGK